MHGINSALILSLHGNKMHLICLAITQLKLIVCLYITSRNSYMQGQKECWHAKFAMWAWRFPLRTYARRTRTIAVFDFAVAITTTETTVRLSAGVFLLFLLYSTEHVWRKGLFTLFEKELRCK